MKRCVIYFFCMVFVDGSQIVSNRTYDYDCKSNCQLSIFLIVSSLGEKDLC